MKRGELNCVMGGPPCQGYSRAGEQNPDDPRNTLIFEYARMIVELNPRTFVMEEVPDIVNFRTPRGTFVLEEFGMILDEGGYMEFSQFCEAQKFVPKSKRFRKFKPAKNMGENEKSYCVKTANKKPVEKEEKQMKLF
jgi:DNA (cytosine-5)-methyltransferase 1